MAQWWVYALLTMAFFGTTNFLLKVASHHGMNSIFASIALWISVGIMGLVFFTYYHGTGQLTIGTHDTSWLIIGVPVVAGVSLAVGMYCLKRAVTTGPAGPAVAISASNAIIVAVLSYAAFREGLSVTKIGGMLLVIFGIFIMSVFE